MKNKEKIFINIFRKDENKNISNKIYSNKITFNLNNILQSKNQNNFPSDEEIYIKFLNMYNDFIKFFFSYKNILNNNSNNDNDIINNNNNLLVENNEKNSEINSFDLFIEKTNEKIKNLEKEAEIIKYLLENLL